MQSAKEAASNVAASAQSGMEKSKALAQEKVEKITSRDPMQKQMATQKKEQRISAAEREKQEARMHNAAVKETASGGGGGHVEGYTTGHPTTATYSTTGAHGTPGGPHQMSALPGHGTGQPMGQVVEGTTQTHPIGTNTGTGMGTGMGRAAARNTHVGGGTGTGPTYGTGGYS